MSAFGPFSRFSPVRSLPLRTGADIGQPIGLTFGQPRLGRSPDGRVAPVSRPSDRSTEPASRLGPFGSRSLRQEHWRACGTLASITQIIRTELPYRLHAAPWLRDLLDHLAKGARHNRHYGCDPAFAHQHCAVPRPATYNGFRIKLVPSRMELLPPLGSLTPAEALLIDAENPFRQPEPLQSENVKGAKVIDRPTKCTLPPVLINAPIRLSRGHSNWPPCVAR